MGYQMPIVVKEIYLPVPYHDMSLEEYKEKFGIDLNEILYFGDITNGNIELKPDYKYSKVYLLATPEYGEQAQCGILGQCVAPITGFKFNENDITCTYKAATEESFGFGIELSIKFDDSTKEIILNGAVI